MKIRGPLASLIQLNTSSPLHSTRKPPWHRVRKALMSNRRPFFRAICGRSGAEQYPGGEPADEPAADSLFQRVRDAKCAIQRLTSRQKQVLSAVARGASDNEIAQCLGVSPHTVTMCKCAVMDRLKASTTADAVRISIYADLNLHEDWPCCG
jgi:DNA-binding CsgD family transcriptional regulator